MRLAPLLALTACGAPAFVPVSFDMVDKYPAYRFGLFASATKKLNPSCASNCEMGVAIEDGGCASMRSAGDGGWVCEGSGSMFFPFQGQNYAAPELASIGRNVAPGSELLVWVLPDDQACRQSFTISGPVEIRATRDMNGACAFTSSP